MRVLTLVPNRLNFSPGQRGSIELWEKVLTPEGIELDFVPFETPTLTEVVYTKSNYFKKSFEVARAYLKRLLLLKDLESYDAVFVYREAALLGPV